MKYLNRYSTVALTGLSTLLAVGVTGCGNTAQQEQQQAKGAFVIIEETAPKKYQVKDEFPAEETRIVLKQLDGTERVLTQEELDKLMQEENSKIDNGTSNLTNPQATQSGGMGLGEAILASAAGALIGSWIGSKLFGNQNYQNNRKAGYKSPSTFNRSQNSFNKPKGGQSKSSRSGFFNNKKSSSGRSGFGG
jgi:hypothetical protein